MIELYEYLILNALLFSIGVLGLFIHRKHILSLFMCLELLLLCASSNFIAFSYYGGDLKGQIFVIFILTVAAAETALGLSVLVLFFRQRKTIHMAALNALKG